MHSSTRNTDESWRADRPDSEPEQVMELREERLVAHKELRQVGDVVIRTELDDVPARLEVDAYSEAVEIEHEPVGQAVGERREPWTEDDTLIVPVYEEQLVVTKRLVLKERLRIRRVGATERQLFEDTLRKERLVVEEPNGSGLVHEVYPTDADAHQSAEHDSSARDDSQPGLLEHMVRKAFE